MIRNAARLRAFTMTEVCAVLVIIGVLVGLLLPAVQSAREHARRNSCANNLLQIGLGVLVYHSSFKQFPTHLSGTDGSTTPGRDNNKRLSFLVAILPHLDQRTMAEEIRQPHAQGWTVLSNGDMYGDSYGDGIVEEYLEGKDDDESQTGEDADEAPLWTAGGPEPFDRNYLSWHVEVPTYRCPSDPGYGLPAMARTNYVACLGDGLLTGNSGPMKEVKGVFVVDPELAKQSAAAMRGVFVPRSVTRMSDVTDGRSQTILLGEIATDLGDSDIRTQPLPGPGGAVLRDNPNWAQTNGSIDSERPFFWKAYPVLTTLGSSVGMARGLRWADGMPLYTAFNTILPPNRELVMSGNSDNDWGVLPPSSRHQGGVHVAFVDASIRFISDSIDAGDANQPTVYVGSPNPPGSRSPYGVWGAMGTRASGELSSSQLDVPGFLSKNGK